MIDFDEFCELMEKFSSDNMEQEIRDAFKLFDVDGSGKISVDEIKEVLKASKHFAENSNFSTILQSNETFIFTKFSINVCYHIM